MTRQKRNLTPILATICFISTLASIVALVVTGAVLGTQGHSTEALGIGAAVTGLIGVIGTFRPKTTEDEVEITNTKSNPVPTMEGIE